MATFSINNVKMSGIASCVPQKKINNLTECSIVERAYREKLCRSIGIFERRICPAGVFFSDLAMLSAEKMIAELAWDQKDIDALIIVSQSPDYVTPSTAIILQDKLGISKDAIAYDVNLGCSGYVFGLHLLACLISSGSVKKGLLLVGDKSASIENPIFSDAATATALEFDENASPLHFDLHSDGSGYKHITVPVGAHREPFAIHHFLPIKQSDGSWKHPENFLLNGPEVFKFAVRSVPESIQEVLTLGNKNLCDIDYVFLHQANKIINNTIVNKLHLKEHKTPSSLAGFGNTSGASIPLTMSTQSDLNNKKVKVIMCGFGVGLSWGSCLMEIDNAKFPPLIEV